MPAYRLGYDLFGHPTLTEEGNGLDLAEVAMDIDPDNATIEDAALAELLYQTAPREGVES